MLDVMILRSRRVGASSEKAGSQMSHQCTAMLGVTLTNVLTSKAIVQSCLICFRQTARSQIMFFYHRRNHPIPVPADTGNDGIRLTIAPSDRVVGQGAVRNVVVRRKVDDVITHEGVKVVRKDGVPEIGECLLEGRSMVRFKGDHACDQGLSTKLVSSREDSKAAHSL